MQTGNNPKLKLFRDLSHSRNLLKSQKPTSISRSNSISSNVKCFSQNQEFLKNLVRKKKKSSSKEVIIQTNLKKSQSLNEELSLIPKTQLLMEGNNLILANQMKRDFEKNIINDQTYDKERFTFYFRSRCSSLIKGLGFQKYYLNNPKTKQIKVLIENEK